MDERDSLSRKQDLLTHLEKHFMDKGKDDSQAFPKRSTMDTTRHQGGHHTIMSKKGTGGDPEETYNKKQRPSQHLAKAVCLSGAKWEEAGKWDLLQGCWTCWTHAYVLHAIIHSGSRNFLKKGVAFNFLVLWRFPWMMCHATWQGRDYTNNFLNEPPWTTPPHGSAQF